MSSRLPVTIFTGFLGSGKTTVLRHLLMTSGQRLAVIVNEFGSIGLDGDLFRSCDFCADDEIDGRLVELNNGCLCCTVQEDFLPTIESLLDRSDKLDGIVIETSGLALPRPLLQALSWPSIRTRVHLNGVVTLVDGQALSEDSPVGDISPLEKQREEDLNIDHLTSITELFDDQLQSSDLVLISRSDLLPLTTIEQIKIDLSQKVRKGTSFLAISNGKLQPELILGFKQIQSDDSFPPRFVGEHEQSEEHHHVKVFSENVRFEGSLVREDLESLLTDLATRYQIVRLKGRCWLPGKRIPLQIQLVGSRLSSWFEKAPATSWTPKNGGIDFVVISFHQGAFHAISEEITKICAT